MEKRYPAWVSVLAFCASFGMGWAATLDLNGTSQEVTTLAGYDEVCNSGAEATLTVNLTAADETFAGKISGSVKLVKTGAKMLSLSGDNDYTGGTQIDGGRLQALSANAFGDKTAGGAIQVNSDCTTTAADASVTALIISVTPFAYDINCAAWPNHGGRPKAASEGYQSMYNIGVGVGTTTSFKAEISGKITGGDVSIREATNGWGDIGKISTLTISGEVNVGDGTFYLVNRCCRCTVTGKLTAGNVLLSNANTPTALTLTNPDNQIGVADVGRYASGGDITCNAVNVLGRAKLISSAALSATGYFDLSGRNQEVDVPMMTTDSAGVTVYPANQTPSNDYYCRHALYSAQAACLTMKATCNATNDWLCCGKLSLVYDPQGDYTLENRYRPNTNTGSLTVKDGAFKVVDGCSFMAISSLTLESDARLELESADSIRNDTSLPVEISSEAKISIGSGTLSVATFKRGNAYLARGSYTKGNCDWLEGDGSVFVSTKPDGSLVGYWKGGAADDNIDNSDNWDGDMPDLTSGGTEIIVTNGTKMVVNVENVVLKSIKFDVPNDFSIEGDKPVQVLSGGLETAVAEAVRTYTVKVPYVVSSFQTWRLHQNTSLAFTGKFSGGAVLGVEVVGDYNSSVLFTAPAGGSDFAGTFHLKSWCNEGEISNHNCASLHLAGVNPLGADSTLKLTSICSSGSGWHPYVYFEGTVISNRVTCHERYQCYFTATDNTTNMIAGAIDASAANFAPVFRAGKNAELRIAGELNMKVQGADALLPSVGTSCSHGTDWMTSAVIFDAQVKSKHRMGQTANIGALWLNAPENDLPGLQGGDYGKNWRFGYWHFGADYALTNGTAALTPAEGNTYWTVIDLHGHPQHVGNLGCGNASTEINSTDGAAALRINQTTDVTFAGRIGANVEIVKEGSAFLGFSHATPFSLDRQSGTVLTLKEGTVGFPADGVSVRQLKYVDGEGVARYVDPGTYTKDNAPDAIKVFFAEGSGPLTVRRGEFPPGLQLIIR